ncbi:ANR family transcriptional regulator [Enterobacter hormaechei]|uniref:ANR family transcriptional regulator n=1 Tax=Enterobacter hormaechei TaxID=158836 RepID=UPI003D7D0818
MVRRERYGTLSREAVALERKRQWSAASEKWADAAEWACEVNHAWCVARSELCLYRGTR